MREIKFRVWSPFKEMISNDVTIFANGWIKCVFDDGEESKYAGQDIVPLMQFTGLKDKNGKEIYEGDILTANFYPFQDDGEYNYHGVIEWDEETASFYMWKSLANKSKRGISHGIGEQIDQIDRFEIIGNIYENPELLEG